MSLLVAARSFPPSKAPPQILGISLAFLLGLNLPKSFTLIALICAVGLLVIPRPHEASKYRKSVTMASLLLVFFGVAYGIRQW
jgi:hypothetical protein